MDKSDRLIFVFGLPRSGTSLLQRILHAHPKIYAGGEFDHLHLLVQMQDGIKKSWERGRYKSVLPSPAFINQRFSEYITQILLEKAAENNKYIYSEKTPQNTEFVHLFHQYFPHSKKITILRHPYDIFISLKKVRDQSLKLTRKAATGKTIDNIIELDRIFSSFNQFYLAQRDAFFILNYKDLLEKKKQILIELFVYLGIEFSDNMLEHEKYLNKEIFELADDIWTTRNQISSASEKRKNSVQLSNIEKYIIALHFQRYDILKQHGIVFEEFGFFVKVIATWRLFLYKKLITPIQNRLYLLLLYKLKWIKVPLYK